MGFMSKLKDTYQAELSKVENRQRTISDRDALGWDEALNERDRRGKTEIRTMQQARRALSLKNPRRWGNLQAEFQWAQKEMQKMGLNPEDVRFML